MSKAKPVLKTVFHPSIPGVTREVAEGDSGSWKDAGWRLTDPAKTTTTTTKSESAKSE